MLAERNDDYKFAAGNLKKRYPIKLDASPGSAILTIEIGSLKEGEKLVCQPVMT